MRWQKKYETSTPLEKLHLSACVLAGVRVCVQLHHYYPLCNYGFVSSGLICFIVHTCISRGHRLQFEFSR